MSWIELQKAQMKEREEFEELRQQAWNKMQKRHTEIIAAFGSEENTPHYVHERLKRESDIWQKRWGNKGTKQSALNIKQTTEEKNLLLKTLNAGRSKHDRGFEI
jgi:hypothetical protein